ncbi:MAG: bifunctional pyr operon transcriptional regulator/uracil phosphoribosyltransferase PyrR [Thiotrichaceae bacterium]|nr:bifunctional pyr operon transcriptional regulator/uracil phosphoribosyltransferase PyrR [Thiotrichaceae bacterium]
MNAKELDIDQSLNAVAKSLRTILESRSIQDPIMIGIYTGGVWIAQQLHQQLAIKAPLGTLDISFYRDDFTRVGMNPQVKPSSLPLSIDDRHIILVDDVLYTGRTIRAAMNELFDYGRPASIILAVLVERDGRELPIQPDAVGQHISLQAGEQIKLQGPAPLTLSLRRV